MSIFQPADILLPQNVSMEAWAVIACDQFTSEPEYWQRVRGHVGEQPSTLRLIFPEAELKAPDVEQRRTFVAPVVPFPSTVNVVNVPSCRVASMILPPP